jgi:hypothetical protein
MNNDEFIFNEKIGGFSVQSILSKLPMEQQGGNIHKVSDLFQNLAIPSGYLYLPKKETIWNIKFPMKY